MPENNKYIVGIGPGKAGTTWFYNFAKNHPDLQVSEIKETNFFLKSKLESDFELSYQKHFPKTFDGRSFVDVSNHYIFSDNALENILKLNNVQIVYFKRDDFERICSIVKFERKLGNYEPVEVILNRLDKGRYRNDHFESLLNKKFGSESITFDFDMLMKNERIFASQLCARLGISDFCYTASDIEKNMSVEPRIRIVVKFANLLARILRHLGFLRMLQSLKASPMLNQVLFRENQTQL